jgi:hypothetical protein
MPDIGLDIHKNTRSLNRVRDGDFKFTKNIDNLLILAYLNQDN